MLIPVEDLSLQHYGPLVQRTNCSMGCIDLDVGIQEYIPKAAVPGISINGKGNVNTEVFIVLKFPQSSSSAGVLDLSLSGDRHVVAARQAFALSAKC
jgi:hypothetical protein